jgi:hypothetical protein
MKGKILFVAVLSLAFACGGKQVRKEERTGEGGFPFNYSSWKRLNPQPIQRDGLTRNLFANEVALHKGAQGKFALGSVLVKEDRRTSDSAQPKVVVQVMSKVASGGRDGWIYKAFDGETRKELPPDKMDIEGCYYCHVDAREKDFVFSDVK